MDNLHFAEMIIEGTTTYTCTVEVARLDNCIQVTVDGEALAYTMAFDGENQPQTATVISDTSSGVSMLYGWNGTASGAGSVSATVTANRTLQEGDIFHLRLITAYAVTDNVVQVTMTPASTQTYA